MQHKGASCSKFRKRRRHGVDHIRRENAEHLCFCACGIGERAEKIENRAPADLLARWCGVSGRGVCNRSEEKAETNFANGAAGQRERQINVHAEGFQYIGGSAAGTRGAIAVLGHARACRGSNNRRRRGNIEGAAGIAAGATGVHHSSRPRFVGSKNRCGVLPHHVNEARQFRRADWASIERRQHAHDVRRGDMPGEQLLHERFRFRARKHAARFGPFNQ